MYTVSTTEIQNNFDKYLKLVMEGKEIIILKNGKEVPRLISQKSIFLLDSLLGVLKAAELNCSDYKDTLQIIEASRLKPDYIITRNTKDYISSKVSALTPQVFIETMLSSNKN